METMTNGDHEEAAPHDVFATIVANQEKISSRTEAKIAGNQKKLDQVLANQKAIQANQTKIAGNQKKLDQVLANQKTIMGNQKKLEQIIANQETDPGEPEEDPRQEVT